MMRDRKIGGVLLLVALGLPAPAFAQPAPCGPRIAAAFVQLPELGQRRELSSPARAAEEVRALFGPPRAELCEPGAYERFMEGLRDLSRQAIRTRREPLLQVAVATAEQAPLRVPAEEGKAAAALYRQVRSDVHATAEDVRPSPLIKKLLEAIDRAGPPASAAGEAPAAAAIGTPGPVAGPAVAGPAVAGPAVAGPAAAAAPASPPVPVNVPVRVPQGPLPPWAVISLHEARDLLRQQNAVGALGKLEPVLRWMDSAP
jgi:hypothetical protein